MYNVFLHQEKETSNAIMLPMSTKIFYKQTKELKECILMCQALKKSTPAIFYEYPL